MINQVRVRVAIVSFRCTDSLRALLSEIRNQSKDWEIFVWDNHSEVSHLLKEELETSDLVDWVYFCSDNIGFAKAVNEIAAVPGSWDVLLTANPDAKIISSLHPVIATCVQGGIAAVGGCLSRSGRRDCTNAFRDVGPLGLALRSVRGRARESLTMSTFDGDFRYVNGWLEGSLLAFSRSAWVKVGPLDERFFLYSEEQDWQRRARQQGWRIAQVSAALIAHTSMGSVSDNHEFKYRSQALQEQSRRQYIRKWWGTGGLFLYLSVTRMGMVAKRSFIGKSCRPA